MHSTLITGLIKKVNGSGVGPNHKLLHIYAGKIDIPELKLWAYDNNIIVNADCYAKDNPDIAKELLNKYISISNPIYNITYISVPEGDDYLKYLQKNLLKCYVKNIAVSNKKLLAINFCQTTVQVDRLISSSKINDSNFYFCTIKGTRHDPAYQCKNLQVLFKESRIKPELGKTYLVMGQIVNFPLLDFNNSTGKHGIYGQITKEVTNADDRDKPT